jgi:hypothetical protein
MKTARLPSISVEPALRESVESVLAEGETLSSFVDESVRAMVRQRQQQAFIPRALLRRDASRRSGRYTPAAEVLRVLESKLASARDAQRRTDG